MLVPMQTTLFLDYLIIYFELAAGQAIQAGQASQALGSRSGSAVRFSVRYRINISIGPRLNRHRHEYENTTLTAKNTPEASRQNGRV
jgi:hypothetical protein